VEPRRVEDRRILWQPIDRFQSSAVISTDVGVPMQKCEMDDH